MYDIYDIYFKILGYKPFKEYEIKKTKKNIILQIIHYAYTCLIFIPLFIPFVYQLIYYIKNWNIDIIVSSFITLLVPIQYILTLIYFRKNHFTNIILKNGYNKDYIFKMNIMTLISIGISLIYTTICLSLTLILNKSSITMDDENIFKNTKKQVYIFFVIINLFCSSNIFFSVNIFFTNTLILHAKNIKNICIKVEEDIKNNVINVLDICNEYLQERENYGNTIKSLNNLFAITFLTSGSYIYIIIYNIVVNKIFLTIYVDFVKIIFYSLMIIMFSFAQNKINDSIQNLIDNIYSVNFIRNNLIRLTIEYNNEKKLIKTESLCNIVKDKILQKNINKNNDEDLNMFSYILDKENANYLDWLVIIQMMKMKWETISFIGFELNGWDMIKQIITLGSSFVILIQALK